MLRVATTGPARALSPLRRGRRTCRPSLSCLHGAFRRTFQSKVVDSAEAALAAHANWDGATVAAVGGLGLAGNPETLIQALSESPTARNLTVASLCGGTDELGMLANC